MQKPSSQHSLTVMTTWTLVASIQPQHMALATKLHGVPGTDIGSASCPLEGTRQKWRCPQAEYGRTEPVQEPNHRTR